jgi:predicted dehydrogenase
VADDKTQHPFRIGIIGLVHDHAWWYFERIADVPNAAITCAADANQPLLEKLQGMLGLDSRALYRDPEQMLDREGLEAVLIFAENDRHAELTELAAAKGLHVMIEKPMAASVAEADRMIAAARRHGVRLMVNFPLFHMPLASGCLRVIEENRIGRVWMMRVILGHSGPENFCTSYFSDWLMDRRRNGGGAMMDFCIYGAALLSWYFGRPDRVSAMSGTFAKAGLAAEDHGVILVRYDSLNLMAVIEGTWISLPDMMVVNLFGDQGSCFNSVEETGRFRLKTADSETIQDLEMPGEQDGYKHAVRYFVDHVRSGEPFEGMADPEIARGAHEILEAAYRSIAERREVDLPL